MGEQIFRKIGPGVSLSLPTTLGRLTTMNETNFRIDYMDDNLAVILSETVAKADDWAACEHGWDNMPEGTTDFQVTMPDAD